MSVNDILKREELVVARICPDCGGPLVDVKEALGGRYVSDANGTAVRCSMAIAAEQSKKSGCVFASYVSYSSVNDDERKSSIIEESIEPAPIIHQPGIDEIAAANTSKNRRDRVGRKKKK